MRQGNSIAEVNATAFINISSSVETIYLNDNPNLAKIEPGAFSNMVNLTYLLVHYSGIEKIEPNTFAGAPNLEILWLHDNEILELEEGAFSGLGKSLKELTLGGNIIQELKVGQFDNLTNLRVLSLPLVSSIY